MNADETSQPADEASAVSTETSGTTESRPSQRIQIGSQRASDVPTEAKAQAVASMGPAVPPKKREHKHYPPPNIRDQLTPEMEAEYAEALGDLSFEALMTGYDCSNKTL